MDVCQQLCEVCGKPTVRVIYDVVEGEPNGKCRTWRPVGKAHPRCADHSRRWIRYSRDTVSPEEAAVIVTLMAVSMGRILHPDDLPEHRHVSELGTSG